MGTADSVVPSGGSNSIHSSRIKVAILLNREQDAGSWRASHARGETIDVTPYGYDRAEAWFDLSWSESRPEGSWARRLRGRTSSVLGFDLIHAWRNRRMLFDADVVWTHTEREHLAVALLQRIRLPSRRVAVLAQSVWLWDRWSDYSRVRRRFVAWLLRTHRVEALHSPANVAVSASAVGGRRVTLLPFGSAPVTRAAERPSEPLVLAVGNDADRDWTTFARAVSTIRDVPIRVASKSRAAASIDWGENVTLGPTDGLAELADLYRRASVVVVPLRLNLHASGATTCIEALAARRPLVASEAGGLESYLGASAQLVPVGDGEAMASAIRAALDGTQPLVHGDPWVERGLTQEDYVARYAALTRWLVGETSWPAQIAEFLPISSS